MTQTCRSRTTDAPQNQSEQGLRVIPLRNFPLVEPGNDLDLMILKALETNGVTLSKGDVLVVAQKVVSKAEGRYVDLGTVVPSERALELAEQTAKDPRVVELCLQESNEVVRQKKGVLVVEHRLGYVHANAGIDRSNLTGEACSNHVLLLPKDPDASANRLLERLSERFDTPLAVIINDSVGRAWRNGVTSMAIGVAGMAPVEGLIGALDLQGRPLEVTEVAVADQISCAAAMMMGEAGEGVPVAVVRGAKWTPSNEGSGALIRPKSEDMFR